ncbi:hypothetical protein [Streptomyces sp. NPDC053048]|uniref:hypothetical protein n=1 Tax=Streptomyces sp. NPDC053048 TaxID=3365694 RepID=UPI0037CEAA17
MASTERIDPGRARDTGEFVALMRKLKERSNLTLRQLEQRAAERGEVLARSTLSDALAREALPRPEVLTAFVRTCGEGERLGAWLEARDRIAAAEPADAVPVDRRPEPEPEPGPEAEAEAEAEDGPEEASDAQEPAPKAAARRARLLPVSAVTVLLALAAVGYWLLSGARHPSSGAAHSDPSRPPAASAASATSAAGTAKGRGPVFSLFEGRSTNGTTLASVGYRYWDTGDGWYGIEYVVPYSRDDRDAYGDGWGGRLRMHYEDRYGAHTIDLTDNPDGEQDAGKDNIRYGLKNAWFEVCNSDGRELRACERLRKARS